MLIEIAQKRILWSNEFEKHILNTMTAGFLAVVLVGVCVLRGGGGRSLICTASQTCLNTGFFLLWD